MHVAHGAGFFTIAGTFVYLYLFLSVPERAAKNAEKRAERAEGGDAPLDE